MRNLILVAFAALLFGCAQPQPYTCPDGSAVSDPGLCPMPTTTTTPAPTPTPTSMPAATPTPEITITPTPTPTPTPRSAVAPTPEQSPTAQIECDVAITMNATDPLFPAQNLTDLTKDRIAKIPIRVENLGQRRANVSVRVYDSLLGYRPNVSSAPLYGELIRPTPTEVPFSFYSTTPAPRIPYPSDPFVVKLDPGEVSYILVDYNPPSDYNGTDLTVFANVTVVGSRLPDACLEDWNPANNVGSTKLAYTAKGEGVGSSLSKTYFASPSDMPSETFSGELTVSLASVRKEGENLRVMFSVKNSMTPTTAFIKPCFSSGDTTLSDSFGNYTLTDPEGSVLGCLGSGESKTVYQTFGGVGQHFAPENKYQVILKTSTLEFPFEFYGSEVT